MPFKFRLPKWTKQPADLKRVGDWINTGRDLAALLFIPFLCLYGAILVFILVRLFGGLDRPENVTLAVVNYLGASLIGMLILIGLGVLWLQRRNIPNLSITTPMGTVNIASGDASQNTFAGAIIDSITPDNAPSVAAATGGHSPPVPSKPAMMDEADRAIKAEGEIV